MAATGIKAADFGGKSGALELFNVFFFLFATALTYARTHARLHTRTRSPARSLAQRPILHAGHQESWYLEEHVDKARVREAIGPRRALVFVTVLLVRAQHDGANLERRI